MRLHTAPTLLDQFFSEFESAFGAPPRVTAHQPPVDVFEYPNRYEVIADLPGVSEKDVEVEFAEGVLEIRGSRSPEDGSSEVRALRRERLGGSFRLDVILGEETDVDGIAARFCDGVLTVTVPKSERARPRQIPVTVN